MRLQRTETDTLIEWRIYAQADMDDFNKLIQLNQEFHSMKLKTEDGKPYIVVKKKKIGVEPIERIIETTITTEPKLI
jgi:hypothetical protein